jgi:hypothetical protein
LSALFLVPIHLFAWTNGELLIWMDNQRGRALGPIAQKFQSDLGLKVTIETPEKITDTFPIAAQAGKGPEQLKPSLSSSALSNKQDASSVTAFWR